ncbi:hypothetical protein HELRODRAFT_73582, partial [Helobdella robusta]|uniref:Synaptic plasticity regulator PANTS n=1 Tax=Helobdella robusta TaxID=6412 RepID=T1G1G1_HELRO
LRPCSIYLDEYKECTSVRGRFHQRYTEGDVKECFHWKQDHANCKLYEKNKDLKALASIIKHEEDMRAERLKRANENNVWEYRTEPPSLWDFPIPAHLTQTFVLDKNIPAESKSNCLIS